MTLALKDVEVDGRRRTVLLADGRVRSIAAPDTPVDAARTIDGRGGVLLPGLHDHHIHLLAAAAWRASVDCTAAGPHPDDLGASLRRQPGAWVRAVNYDDAQAGPLDRHVLDRWVADRPVRVQHRGGALWVLNTAALQRVAHVLDDSGDVELDASGTPNGRLWRYDARLRPALPPSEVRQQIAELGDELLGYGLTGVTDATPDLDADGVALLRSAQARGELPQRLVLLGMDATEEQAPGLRAGPRKLVVRDHDLPQVEELAAQIERWHGADRPVAVHTVSAEALVLVLAALDASGTMPGDRIEHASMIPAGLEPWVRATGATIVTQPDFLRTRGDSYLRDLEHNEHGSLYRYGTLVGSGIPVVCSSDAPYGVPDPWATIRSARDRLTASGVVLGPDERVTSATALDSYLRRPLDLTAAPRRVRVGATADLCLLHTGLVDALADPSAQLVRLVVLGADGDHRVIGDPAV